MGSKWVWEVEVIVAECCPIKAVWGWAASKKMVSTMHKSKAILVARIAVAMYQTTLTSMPSRAPAQ